MRGGGGLIADAAYAASKAGVLNLVKSVAREIAGVGVRINALAARAVRYADAQGDRSALKVRIAEGLPMRRMGTPADMADAILFPVLAGRELRLRRRTRCRWRLDV